MKVFISSVITGYESQRAAVAEAIESLGHEAIRAEDFHASSSSPQVACLDGLRDADLVVMIMGARYGATQASGISATHEEFKEARSSKQIVAFVEKLDSREPQQADFVGELQKWQGGLFTENFATPDELRKLATRFIHDHDVQIARGFPDSAEIITRALKEMPPKERGYSSSDAALLIAVAGGPMQNLLRPAELQRPELERSIKVLLLHGENAVLDLEEGIETTIDGKSIQVIRKRRVGSVRISADGTILFRVPIPRNSGSPVLIEEEIRELILRVLRLTNELLNTIDPTERLKQFGIACRLENTDYMGWKTRSDRFGIHNSHTIRMSSEDSSPVMLVPPSVPRAALRVNVGEMAEDFTILLKQQMNS